MTDRTSDQPVSAIRNLGPKSTESYARAGMHSAEQVRALGADEAYRRLLTAGSRPHFIAYYALVMGLQGRPWNDATADEKRALRSRFDTIVAGTETAPDLVLERELDTLGLRIAR